jgi:hypothetical protein
MPLILHRRISNIANDQQYHQTSGKIDKFRRRAAAVKQRNILLFFPIALLAHIACPDATDAQPLKRAAPLSGQIAATKGGEPATLIPRKTWQRAVVQQDLKTGDVLRTNAAGTLAIVFADGTQVRLGRTSSMVVRLASKSGTERNRQSPSQIVRDLVASRAVDAPAGSIEQSQSALARRNGIKLGRPPLIACLPIL